MFTYSHIYTYICIYMYVHSIYGIYNISFTIYIECVHPDANIKNLYIYIYIHIYICTCVYI